jgi:hypothetical protein
MSCQLTKEPYPMGEIELEHYIIPKIMASTKAAGAGALKASLFANPVGVAVMLSPPWAP